ncbi:vanadium-dependent haloperoxidase [Cyanobium sp. BA5m-21]|uniref:vanadium-dependent haloperoxidase n=1 Tax=Cyanobium sp. BA5m-10 TaxID=2823705 RepID=UPI0020CE8381|nr:vanadium-dependent haloperoxidase [Cyanobium sp. BA5m-10]MCP9905190.1 vanadium-dependent haloperoxidase [Cyanobium sp. BA5m-10]MCP9907614.1 vanadium-dependent haloperoxidase [Cyanobium sp. BA5m-21]
MAASIVRSLAAASVDLPKTLAAVRSASSDDDDDDGAPSPQLAPGGAQTSEFDGRDHGGDDGDFETASSPDQLLAWNQLALDLATAARRGPTISSRLYALVNTALYDSWAIFDEDAKGSIYNHLSEQDLEDLLDQTDDLDQDSGLQRLRDAVIAVAADTVIRTVGATLFSGGVLPQTLLDRSAALMELQLAALQPGTPEGAALRAIALNLGGQVSASINSYALLDGSNQQNNYADTTGYEPAPSRFDPANPRDTLDTTWQPLPGQRPLTPQWGGVTPFASGRELMPDSVLTPYTSDGSLNPLFVAELNQVLQYSMNLTAEQKAIAEYWEAGPGSAYPPGVWMGFTNDLIRDRQLSLDQAMKLSFGVSQSLLDASIGTWATKYHFDSVRPITAIREYYYGRTTTDSGEPLTDWRETPLVGQAWRPYQNPAALTPSFPDVNSGHSAYSSAASTFIRNYLGSNVFGKSVTLADDAARFDPNGFDGQPDTGTAITLSWDYLNGAAEQAGLSRLYGGIHFNDGNWQGQILGTRAGTNASLKAFSLFGDEDDEDDAAATTRQEFGTMTADVLTGLPDEDTEGVRESYGFGGDDLLIDPGTDGHLSLFGGDGLDRFRLSGDGEVWIRDLQAGEFIELHRDVFKKHQSLSDVAFLASDQDPGFTDLTLGKSVLARLDGLWSSAQVNLDIWA